MDRAGGVPQSVFVFVPLLPPLGEKHIHCSPRGLVTFTDHGYCVLRLLPPTANL